MSNPQNQLNPNLLSKRDMQFCPSGTMCVQRHANDTAAPPRINTQEKHQPIHTHMQQAVSAIVTSLLVTTLAWIPLVYGAQTKHIPPTELSAIHHNPALIGKVISVHACLGIPLSDAPDDPMEKYQLLYPCSARLDDESLRNIAILATPESDAAYEPLAHAGIDFDRPIQGDFVGTLTKQKLSADDNNETYVLVVQTVMHIQNAQAPTAER